MAAIDKILKETIPGLQKNVEMRKHTTFKVGGPAKYFALAHSYDELLQSAAIANTHHVPFVVLGGGSNVIVADDGYDGLIIKTGGGKIVVDHETVIADANCNLAKVSMTCFDYGLRGMEWGVGVPGNIGGAIVGNAGNRIGEIKDAVTKVEILDEHNVYRVLSKEECDFGYRDSIFKQKPWTVLRVTFTLTHDDPIKIKERMDGLLEFKRDTQATPFSNSGCMFQNYLLRNEQDYADAAKYGISDFILYSDVFDGDYIGAGALIDKGLHMKGFQLGGVKISEKHANFLLNTGNATAEHVLMMVGIIKQKVRTNFGIQLHEEFRYIY